jgi:NitT/TauT family transport system permease protein
MESFFVRKTAPISLSSAIKCFQRVFGIFTDRMRNYLSIIIFLLAWEVLSRLKIINPIFFPPFTVVLGTVVDLFKTGIMGVQVRVSLMRAIAGFILASMVGVPLGLVLGSFFPRVKTVLEIPLEVFSQINPFLLFHILIFFMGIGESPKIAIIFWTCLYPITFSTMHGASVVNTTLIKAGRAFGLDRKRLLFKIVIPASMPLIFSGLRLSLGYSMFMLIAAEMMGASSGLGWLVLTSQENFQLNRMYATVMVIALLGLLLDAVIWTIGRRYLSVSLEDYTNSTDS